MSTAHMRMPSVSEERDDAKRTQSESKLEEYERRDEEKTKERQGQGKESFAVESKGRVSPLLQPGVKAVGGHAPLPQSPSMAGAGGSTAPPSASLLQGLPGESLPSPRRIITSNSRTQKKAAKASALGETSATLQRVPGRTITGLLTPEARAEEERIVAASKGHTNVQSIFDIMEEDKEQIQRWYESYTNSRDVHEQSSKVKRFVSALAQFLDKLQTVVYSHLLTIVAPRSLAPHEHPTSRQSKLFRSDPQALLRHLSRRANEINNALYDFVHMPMHGPGWEHKLKHILELLRAHSSLQREYLYPLMRALYPSDEDRVAYGQAWTDYLLRAKTAPQPPVVTEEIGRMSHLSGVPPLQLARAFQQQAHI